MRARDGRPWRRDLPCVTMEVRFQEGLGMHLSRSMEGLAVAIAVILILFTPMLDPLASFALAIVVLAGLFAAAYLGLHRPHAPHH
jgi:hypothetical protein